MQSPLKEKYREDPQSALITLTAKGKIGEAIWCKVRCQDVRWLRQVCIQPRARTGLLACSGDLLLEALVACAGVTISAVAAAVAM